MIVADPALYHGRKLRILSYSLHIAWVLGDGAEWIKTQADEHFPDAVKILDGPHLWRKIRDAVRALQPGKRPARRAWRKEQYEVLLPLRGLGECETALAHAASPAPGDRRSASSFGGRHPLFGKPKRLDGQLRAVAWWNVRSLS